jgi:rieske iron-sulfur protein
MTDHNTNASPCCGCKAQQNKDPSRRDAIKMVSLGTWSAIPFLGSTAKAQAAPLLIVDADAEQDFKPLRPSDLAVGKPMLVYPFDAKAGKPLNETRLNKMVVIRLPEDQMAPDTKSKSASSILAYSSICTHQACDVKTWIAKEKVLACFCHASKFDLLDGAKVVSGPAPRPLPGIALSMAGDFIAIQPGFPANQGS